MSKALEWLSRRVEDDSSFLGSVLAEFATAEKLDDLRLVAALGCPPENLPLVRLCRTPRTDPAGFRADITEIAAAFAVDALRLASVVRRVRALRQFRGPGAGGSLLAARERSDGSGS